MIAEAISGFLRQAATTISPTHPRDPALAKIFGIGQNTKSGVKVDEEMVLALPAAWRAVNIIFNGTGSIQAGHVSSERHIQRCWHQYFARYSPGGL